MKKNVLRLLLLGGVAMLTLPVCAKNYVVKSPSGKLVLTVNTDKALTWQVSFNGQEITAPSAVALKIRGGAIWGTDAPAGKITKVSRTLDGVNYRKAKIDDTFTMLTLKGGGYELEFRAYDDAAAYRFAANAKDSLTVENETVEYNFKNDHTAWVPYVNDERHGERYSNSFEAYYDVQKVSQIPSRKLCLMPFVMDMGNGVKAALTTVGEVDYPGMYLHSSFSKGFSLVGEFPGYPDLKNMVPGTKATENFKTLFRQSHIARIGGKQQMPWRAIIVSENDAQLANCDLAQKLSRPVAKGDWSWVKPGKVAWEWWSAANITGVDFVSGINTDTYKYYVDFAAKYNLEYIILDGGWSGKDICESNSNINMPELLAYAKQKGVGVIVWASWKNVMEKMHEAFPLYEKWGVKGMKIDFVDGNDQYVMKTMRDITALAAKHHLIIDYHGMQLNGLQVMYPNIVNIEGVRGLEQCKWTANKKGTLGSDMPGYDVTIPFARMLTAPMDYTPGAMRNATRDEYRPINNNPMSQGTRVHQMAMYTVFDAPLQMLSDKPSLYYLYPECTEFIAKVPTTFDDCRVVQGEIGKYIVTAKQKGSTWFVGAMTNWDERDLEISLDFLGDGTYKAIIFRDGINASKSAEDYMKEEKNVKKTDRLKISMKSGGGWTARFEKI